MYHPLIQRQPTPYPTPYPSPRPTPRPTPQAVVLEVTTHQVLLSLTDVPSGYRLSQEDKVSLLLRVKDLLVENLDVALELVEITYASTRNCRRLTSRRLDTISLALQIKVKGPLDISDFALSYVIEVLEDYKLHVVAYMQSLNWNAFRAASITIDPYDPSTPIDCGPTTILEKTEHSVQLSLKNVPTGHRISASDRASILRWVDELLKDNLDESLELVSVAYLDSSPTSLLPLLITVKSPSDEAVFASSRVMIALEDSLQDLMRKIKSLDWNAYKNVVIVAESYDPSSTATLQRPSEETFEMDQTEHLVQLILRNVPAGHSLSASDRASILRFIKDLLEDCKWIQGERVCELCV